MPSAQNCSKTRVPGIGLVGQADLDVLRVARDPRVGEAGFTGDRGGERGDLREVADPG